MGKYYARKLELSPKKRMEETRKKAQHSSNIYKKLLNILSLCFSFGPFLMKPFRGGTHLALS